MIAKKIERKRKFQKYLNIMKPKRRSQDLTYTLKQEDEPIKHPLHKEEHLGRGNADISPVWEDPDDNDEIDLTVKNTSKKLIRDQNVIPQKEYTKRVEEFYQSKQQKEFTSWAVEGDDGDQHQEAEVFEEEFEVVPTSQRSIEFFSKLDYKHNSVISDLCWSKNKLFATGLDKVLSIHQVQNKKLCHNVHFKDLPLTNCTSINNKIYIGTLRKNYIVYDANHSHQELYSSTFLSQHKTYSNLRAGENTLSIFSNKLISLFSLNNQFIGELYTNQPLTDVAILGHDIVATTKNSIYRWDNRNQKIIEVVQTGLNNTSVAIVPNSDTLLVGTFSGMTYIHTMNPSMKEVVKEIPNLTTAVSGMCCSPSGDLVVAHSKWKKNGIRVIDMNRYGVVQGWPSVTTKLSFPSASSIAEDGKWIATGSTNGVVSIYNVVN